MKKFWLAALTGSMVLGITSPPVFSQHPQEYPNDYQPEYYLIPEYKQPTTYYHPPHYTIRLDSNENHRFSSEYSALYHQAINAYKVRNYVRAVALFKQVLKNQSGDAALMTKYGYALMKTNHYEEALQIFEDVAQTSKVKKFVDYSNQIIPELKKALAELKARSVRVSKPSQSTVTVETQSTAPTTQAPELQPVANSEVEEAEKLLKQGFFDQAIEKLTLVITKDESNALARFNRGLAFRYKRDYDLAMTDLNKAAELGYKDKMLFHERGWILSQQAKLDEAISELNQSIKLDDKFPQVYITRGQVYAKQKNCSAATSDYEKACDLGAKEACALQCSAESNPEGS